MRFEYKVVPAPTKGLKAKGVKTAEDRFANALSTLMNAEARNGWEYLRTDTLPMVERKGFTRSATVYQNMLVFRRALSDAAASLSPTALEAERDIPALPRLVARRGEETPPPVAPVISEPKKDEAAPEETDPNRETRA